MKLSSSASLSQSPVVGPRSWFSHVLLVLSSASLVLGVLLGVYAPSPAPVLPSTLTTTTPPSPPEPGTGWSAPAASLGLSSLLPTLPQVRPILSSSLYITSDGPLPLDSSIDAPSAALAPGVRSAWSRVFDSRRPSSAFPDGTTSVEMVVLSYGSSVLASSALKSLADVLHTSLIPSSAPSPSGFSLPPADSMFLAPTTPSGTSRASVGVLRDRTVLLASAPSLAQALLAVSLPASLVESKAPARKSSIGSASPLRTARALSPMNPPLAPTWPLPGLEYPTWDYQGCITADTGNNSPVWHTASCQGETELPTISSSAPLPAPSR